MDVIRQYNQIGKAYVDSKDTFFSGREDWGDKLILKNMGEVAGKTVLDMGCGDGTGFLKYQKMGARVIGVDPSQFMIDEARKKLGAEAELFLGDYEAIPLSDNSVDMIVGRYSIHYLKDFTKAYPEISRVLKPGGFFVLLTAHPTGDRFMPKEKNDDGEELVCVPLYGGKVTVKYRVHPLAHYFSPEFFKLFNLDSFDEFMQAETDQNIVMPTAMVIKGVRK